MADPQLPRRFSACKRLSPFYTIARMKATWFGIGLTCLAVAAIGTGCLSTSKLYEGPERPLEEVAILLQDPNAEHIEPRLYETLDELRRVVIESVDGARAKGLFFAKSGRRILLLPGPHVMTIGLITDGEVQKQNVKVRFVAEPGRSYFLTAEVNAGRKMWKPIIKSFPHDPAKLGKIVWSWKPADIGAEWAEVEFPLGDAFDGEGVYEIEFLYDGGENAIAIEWVALTAGGAEVARDPHPGGAGRGRQDTIYRLKLVSPAAGAHYGVKARVKGAGGTDCSGKVAVRKRALR